MIDINPTDSPNYYTTDSRNCITFLDFNTFKALLLVIVVNTTTDRKSGERMELHTNQLPFHYILATLSLIYNTIRLLYNHFFLSQMFRTVFLWNSISRPTKRFNRIEHKIQSMNFKLKKMFKFIDFSNEKSVKNRKNKC